MAVLYVASDQPRAGKTTLSITLAHELRRQGKQAAVFKPLAATAEPDDDPDPTTYQRLLSQSAAGKPFRQLKSGLTPRLLQDIKGAFNKSLEGQDVLLVEGPDVPPEVASRLVDELDARVLMVTRFQPPLDASELARWKKQFGDRLLGFLINGLTLHQGTELRTRLLPSMSSAELPSLGVIPEDRRLLGLTVGQLASHLQGQFILGEEFADRLVEHFMVGGWSLDSGELYFGLRENKAVIVRGNRPDIQMGALATPTACMVLTQGIDPIEYVLNEAELEEVPIIVVESDTLSTMGSLNTVQDSAQFDHPAKLERASDLLRKYVDMPAICAGLDLAA